MFKYVSVQKISSKAYWCMSYLDDLYIFIYIYCICTYCSCLVQLNCTSWLNVLHLQVHTFQIRSDYIVFHFCWVWGDLSANRQIHDPCISPIQSSKETTNNANFQFLKSQRSKGIARVREATRETDENRYLIQLILNWCCAWNSGTVFSSQLSPHHPGIFQFVSEHVPKYLHTYTSSNFSQKHTCSAWHFKGSSWNHNSWEL